GTGARQRRAVVAGRAPDPPDRGGPVDDGTGLLDRHRPVDPDRVPHQLVVVGERVQRAAHAVRDVVDVRPGDRLVGVADLDALVVALVLHRVLRGRALRGAHRDDVERVDAVVAVLPRLVGAHRDVA